MLILQREVENARKFGVQDEFSLCHIKLEMLANQKFLEPFEIENWSFSKVQGILSETINWSSSKDNKYTQKSSYKIVCGK